MTTLTRPAPKVRRVRFDYPTGSRFQHYVNGDLVMSHVVAVLSSTFPEGEDFFVRSVRAFADQITDPVLKEQVAGFVGQEVTHGREHRELNERLQAMGYPTRRIDRFTKVGLARYERFLSPAACLALTAAFEHYTATFASTLLSSPKAQELLGTTEVREMLLWHALEEWEHKAVAFDVLATVSGSEKLRIRAMRWVMVDFALVTVALTVSSMVRDPASRDLRRLVRELRRPSPFLNPTAMRHLRAYTRKGFHPDDLDHGQLDGWREQLLGEQGALTPHVR